MSKRLVSLTLALVAITISVPVQAAVLDCSDQVMATCTSCHYQTRICEKLGQKSRRDWQKTLKRMLRYGLVLDDKGQGKILDCLTSLDKASAKLCK